MRDSGVSARRLGFLLKESARTSGAEDDRYRRHRARAPQEAGNSRVSLVRLRAGGGAGLHRVVRHELLRVAQQLLRARDQLERLPYLGIPRHAAPPRLALAEHLAENLFRQLALDCLAIGGEVLAGVLEL